MPPSCRNSGFTLVEVLVSTAILGILVGLLLPAVSSARESARATTCKGHARQIGITLYAIGSRTGRFPANQPVPWTIETMREIDPPLLPSPSPANRELAWELDAVAWTRVPTLICPSDAPAPAEERAIANHALNHGLAGLRLASVSDGLSQTLLTGEIASACAAPWTWGPLADDLNIGSVHPASIHLSLADGSVRGMSRTVDPSVLRSLLGPNDGNVHRFD